MGASQETESSEGVVNTHYSPLHDINARNVEHLGFAWDYRLGTNRGLEATPMVVDGIMYASGNWGRVYAINARTGQGIWTYDPHVSGQWGRYACCDIVNRGLAFWHGRVFVASLDGYLHAIDAATGRRIWRVDTLPERRSDGFHYFVTGAPAIAGDLIVIGNGGADFKGARGSVSAYSLTTGAIKWRFYTVPRDPRLGPQDRPHLQAAVHTWPSRYDWSMGGGGNVWDSIAYDPTLQLVYFGTANASPYHAQVGIARTGDELFVASIVAVHAETGKMAWYYQEVPGEGSDYDATNKLVLTDLAVRGKHREVIMQASKDGFLYVLDAATGEFLSGTPFAHINWTTGLDPATHRPMKGSSIDWERKPALLFPGAIGAHNWQPMSFSPETRLVYIPVIDAGMIYVNTASRPAGLMEGSFDSAFFFPEDYGPKELESLFGKLPPLSALLYGEKLRKTRGLIRAIRPMTGKIVWQGQTASYWDGGILSTGGNLVFQGDAAGYLNVYEADSGKLLKSIDVRTSIMAAPMTYRVDGVQYVSVMAGYGGGVLYLPFPQNSAAFKYGNDGRIVTFKLNGGATPKLPRVSEASFDKPPPREGTPAIRARGEVLYNRYCARCHVFGRGLLPDLRRVASMPIATFKQIVLGGAFSSLGMGHFDDVLSNRDVESVHSYLVDEARIAYARQGDRTGVLRK